VLIFVVLRSHQYQWTLQFLRTVLWNVSFLFNIVPAYQVGIVSASWTIGVEMLFYVVFPIVYLYSRRNLTLLVMMVCALILVAAFKAWVFQATLTGAFFGPDGYYEMSAVRNFPVFLVGVFAYDIFTRNETAKLQRRLGVALILAAAVGYLAIPNVAPIVRFPLRTLVSLLLLLGLAISPTRLLVNRFTRYIGTISYSMYLLHIIVIEGCASYYARIYSLPVHYSIRLIACLTLTLGLTVIIASITFRVIEKPGIALGRRFVAFVRRAPVADRPIAAAQSVNRK
jgi:peptidoglycan/LPS O-acetylase OafA/YrhL